MTRRENRSALGSSGIDQNRAGELDSYGVLRIACGRTCCGYAIARWKAGGYGFS